ncbi:MAG: hypothetical protein DKINENOH_01451 [bacterium]|nr:hypothetical protein [bacterium]
MKKWSKAGLLAIFSLVTMTSAALSQTARLQVIHNAADPAAASVDVYLNGHILLDNFAFRTATPYIDAPAGTPIQIAVAPGNSTSAAQALKNFTVTLNAGETYVAIANGVLDASGFAANPDGGNTNFTLFLRNGMRESAQDPAKVEFRAVHGATDAPTVDVIARGVATLVDNAKYGDVTGYLGVPPAAYTLDVTPGSDNSTVVASFNADLSGLAGGAAVVFASGFLNPAANQNGAAFGLYAALPNGAVVAFPQIGTARLQVIHNAADPAAAKVDVYVNGGLLLNDFAFRTATPFVDVPAGVRLSIAVAPGTSTSVSQALATFNVTLENGKTYVAIANGVLNPGQFSPNPDSLSIGFTLFTKAEAREQATASGNVDFFAVHGATDAPTVDVIARGVATLVDDAKYGDLTGYLSVPPGKYTLDVTPGFDNSNVVASFSADLSGLAGGSAVVLASGFLNPAVNQNGKAFTLIAALANGTVVEFPRVGNARLQVIHNAADPAAASVDVYVNGGLLLNDFAFRTATPFVEVPANVPLSIAVAPGTSSSVAEALATFNVTLEIGKTYIAIANGVLAPAQFAANPDGVNIGFTLFTKAEAREQATAAGNVDFFAVHGATDAPTVDVIARGVATLVDNAKYGDVTGYLSVPPASYTLDITPGNDNATIVASFVADLSGLAGGSAAVLASGFLNPAANQNGKGFGLIAVLANGTVIELPVLSDKARLQVIHNAADPAAEKVDVYVNGSLLLNDFAFRTATPFVEVPADVPLSIAVAPGTSASVAEALATFEVTLAAGKSYIAVANGVLDPTKFAANPDGVSIGFTLFTQAAAREKSNNPNQVDFFALHGATDAPTVDVIARGVATLVDNAKYGDLTGYLSVPAGKYTLDITPGGDNSTLVAAFQADLSGLAGSSLAVLASGFLNPAANQNGKAFGLIAVLANGTVVELPQLTTARLQVIHNSADAAAARVDVYLNGGLLLDNFGFRRATPFIDAPAGVPLSIAVAPSTSTSVNEALKTFTVTLQPGETYVAIASGVLDPTKFAANPEGRDTGFTLFLYDGIRETGSAPGNIDLVVVHGSTDAPRVDVVAVGVGKLVDDLVYGDISGYLSVPAADYFLDLTDPDNGTPLVRFIANLARYGGQSAVVYASGFLDRQANRSGAGLLLMAALPSGQMLAFPDPPITDVNDDVPQVIQSYALSQNYPNPFNPSTTISFDLVSPELVTLKVFDAQGREVALVASGAFNAGRHSFTFDAQGLPSGTYFYRIQAGDFKAVRKMVLMK